MDRFVAPIARFLAVFAMFIGVPKLVGRLTFAFHSHGVIDVDLLASACGGLAALGLLAFVVFGPERPLSLWLRLGGVAAFEYIGVTILEFAMESFTFPKNFSYWPPLVLLAAAPLAWGSFTAIGHDDGERLRSWVVQCLYGAIGLCVFIDLVHAFFPRSLDPFEPLTLLPLFALAAVIWLQKNSDERLPLMLVRWGAGYLLGLASVAAFIAASDWVKDPTPFILPGLFAALLLSALGLVTGWLSWRVFADRYLYRKLAIFGGNA
jgi:hypothetical protein